MGDRLLDSKAVLTVVSTDMPHQLTGTLLVYAKWGGPEQRVPMSRWQFTKILFGGHISD